MAAIAARTRGVHGYGEPLLPEIRAEVERARGEPVLNYYACSEAGTVAISCHRSGDGLHLAGDLLIVEPVSTRGQPVAPGERADKIYVTSLFNHTLPLIRYEITDELTLLGQPCSCGSGHRLIADPRGRLDDTFGYGKITVHPHVFRSPLSGRRDIIEYQVQQTPRGALISAVCPGPANLHDLEAELGFPTHRAGGTGTRSDGHHRPRDQTARRRQAAALRALAD